MQISVKLVIATKTLTANPTDDVVAPNNPSVPIKWSRDTTGDEFTFDTLTELPDPPFTPPALANGEFTSTDNNTGIYSNKDYFYKIQVTGSDGNKYTTAAGTSSPRIHNN